MAASCDSPLGIFYRSISSIFDGWTVLQLAVHHGYGGIHGREKASWMVDAVYNWFQDNDGIEPDELEGFISEILDNEFDTRAEDGSLLSISKRICGDFDKCKSGSHAVVLQSIQETPKASLDSCQAAANQDTEDTDDAPTHEHNLHAMMGNIEMSTNDGTPVMNGFNNQEQPSKTESPKPETDDDGWTTVTKGRKK
ncbi:pre-rRNA-processing protein TSR2 homolog [Asterias amurensis]|uniref:pre-rRNA-processing protein TSR2 homolog n=1 Tax=Asterias amurensis TaxID=7602 RepID=UPI003AB683F1